MLFKHLYMKYELETSSQKKLKYAVVKRDNTDIEPDFEQTYELKRVEFDLRAVNSCISVHRRMESSENLKI